MRPDDREIASIITSEFGANATYVEDLLRQFRHNPRSVGDEWGAYFASLLGEGNGAATVSAAAPAAAQSQAPAPPAAAPQRTPEPAAGERLALRGAALKIVENMEASLSVPTATSQRELQIKVLDENRRWINRHLASR